MVSKNYKSLTEESLFPTRLAKDLTFEQVSKLEENKFDLKGIYYQQFPERHFPSKIRASHVLGYVKEVDKRDKKITHFKRRIMNWEIWLAGMDLKRNTRNT